jgi:hypothetical protein
MERSAWVLKSMTRICYWHRSLGFQPTVLEPNAERKSAASEMFNIPNDDWCDKVDAVLDSMDAVISRGGRNEKFNLLCKLP